MPVDSRGQIFMSALPRKSWTVEQYLEFERASEAKHEFVGSAVFAMTGASENHNLIVANIIVSLGVQLRQRPCKIYPSDMLVQIADTGDFHYPDITIVCGEAQINRDKRDSLLNPTVIIEVLSPSTELYDRGKKFQNYRTLDSLQLYLLVAQDAARIECFTRQDEGLWLFVDTAGLAAVIELPSIGCTLSLADVYDKVSFTDA